MSEYLALPQGITTLADTRPGARVIVHSLLSPRDLPPRVRTLSAGESLVCTRLLDHALEFERADGTRFRLGPAQALRVRVDRFEDDLHEHGAAALCDTGSCVAY